MKNSKQKTFFIISLLVLVSIGFVIYFPGLQIKYYGDDFQFVFDSQPAKIFYYFLHKNPSHSYAYRPIEASFLAFIQSHFGLATLPIHLTNISVHILLSWFILIFMLKLGFSRLQAISGSVFMVVSQANVHAVLSNDSLSQLSGTFFGCMSLWLLFSSMFYIKNSTVIIRESIRYKYYFFSVLMFLLSFLSKETGTSFFLLLFGIILIKNLTNKNLRSLIIRIVVEAVPYFVVVAFYFIARTYISVAKPTFGPGTYDFHIGINVFKNLAMFFFDSLIPVSSVSVFEAFKTGKFFMILITVILTFAFFVFLVKGLLRSKRHNIVLVMVFFSIFGLFPMVIMNHVSELYLYNSIPFISILVGIAVGELLEPGKTRHLRINMKIAIIALLFICHVTAIQHKASLMKDNGEQATKLLNQITPYISRVPHNGNLFLLNPPSNQVEYSIFLMRGFNVLKFGLHRIKYLSKRDDLKIKIIDPLNLEQTKMSVGSVFLSLHGDKVQIYQEEKRNEVRM